MSGVYDERDRHDMWSRPADWGDDAGPFTIANASVITATDKAILVRTGGPFDDDDMWVPRSVIDDDSDVYDNTPDASGPGDLIVAGWWAEKRGLE